MPKSRASRCGEGLGSGGESGGEGGGEGGGGEGGGDEGLGGGGEGGGGEGLGRGGEDGWADAKNIGNHCGGVPLRSDTRIVGKREPGLASVMPRMLPTRIPPCAIERRQVKRGAHMAAQRNPSAEDRQGCRVVAQGGESERASEREGERAPGRQTWRVRTRRRR